MEIVRKKPKPNDTPFPPELFQLVEGPSGLLFVFSDETRTIIWGCKEEKWLQ